MTPFVAFLIGAFCSGTVLALIFGSFHLEAEERAYQKGYSDGLMKVKEYEVE
jgi:hypothetical protein